MYSPFFEFGVKPLFLSALKGFTPFDLVESVNNFQPLPVSVNHFNTNLLVFKNLHSIKRYAVVFFLSLSVIIIKKMFFSFLKSKYTCV